MQDDWRASKNLTVNFGVRYEYSSVVREQHNLLGNFDPNSATGLIQAGQSGVNSPYNPDHKNFAPRLGFAWDVNGKGRTVIRGGAGLVYETVNWEAMLAFNNAFGLGNVPTAATIDAAGDTAGGTITAGNLAILTGPTAMGQRCPIFRTNVSTTTLNCFDNPCAIMGVDRKVTTPYVWNWTLNLQHAITSNLSLEVAYVGNHGSNLVGIRDINQPPVGSGWPAAAQASLAVVGYDPNNCVTDRLSEPALPTEVPLPEQHFPDGKHLQVQLRRPAGHSERTKLSRSEHGGRVHLFTFAR